MAEVTAVIVSMDRPDLLYPCLNSILACNSCKVDIFVVAYMFSQGNLDALQRDYPSVRVIVNDSLSGFSENNNLALKLVESEFVFIVNDDTIQKEPVIDKLLADIKGLPESVAAVSPKIVFADGSVQTCGRPQLTVWRWMKHYLHIEENENKPGKWNRDSGLFRTYTLNGACFLARTSAFRQAGWFDETYTFTPEDIALGHKFNEMGLQVYADADVSIVHLANSTASAIEAAIKPTRIRGSLIFLSRGSKIRYFLLGAYACAIECARYAKYMILGCRTERARVMKATAKNVLASVFSGKSTKEIFTHYYGTIR